MLIRLTQDAAAQKMSMARTTMVAIEAGKRQISINELRSFAELYNVSESELLSGNRQPLDIEAKFRAAGGEHEAEEQAEVTLLLNRLASSMMEIEHLLGIRPARLNLPTFKIDRDLPLEQQAEDAALSARERLGIGLSPIGDLIGIMENELGFRVFERPLPNKVGGAVIVDEEYGCFILLNSSHPPSRRRLTASHEICHPFLQMAGLTVLFEEGAFENKEDKFCDMFARSFLMPAVAVRKKHIELKTLSGDFSVRHLLMMAIYFSVSIEAMARRLEALGLGPKGLANSIRERGVGIRQLESVRQEMGGEPGERSVTPRLMLLAGAAYDRGLLSEQQIAKKLDLDIVDVRQMLSGISSFGE
jgi:Zn-dependent peptidase ImmA (M78 family)/DNA-binding XRE family transcriptional regulator